MQSLLRHQGMDMAWLDRGFEALASLRGKITAAYVAVALLMLAASVFFVSELRTLEQRVERGQRVTDLFDTVLEIRRFERNYFLHRQAADRIENRQQIERVQALLTRHRDAFLAVASASRLDALEKTLAAYGRQMDAYAQAESAGRPLDALEPQVRALGKEVVLLTEQMARSERQQIRATLASFRDLLLGVILCMAVFIVVIGAALSRRVVRPLKEMERSVAAISASRRETLAAPSRDREIVSIIDAFNHMLKELDLRQKSLMRSERLASLGTMLSGVAHELNNPLSNISTSCQILLEEADECEPATARKYLTQIDQQTERARSIVRSLLNFSREQPFRREMVGLKRLVEQTIGFVRGEVPAKSVVTLAIPDDLAVAADVQRLQQVLVNLIRNAVESVGAAGRIVVEGERLARPAPPAGTALGPGCEATDAMVEIRVIDNGPGISPEMLPRVFDPFFTTKDVGQGMGLGLFVAYEIVDAHGGCIAVESTLGQGTTFRVRLPAATLPELPERRGART